ncbi:MAG: tRNA lysidine(34) synthetase TilS [Burkholderiaceae bacterium]
MNGSSPTADSVTRASDKDSHPAFAVAVSGGPDSMALLWTAWKMASSLGLKLHAFHVHHGLQSAADAWPGHVVEECRRWSQAQPEREPVEVHVHRLKGRPVRGQSVEDWARRARYEALVRMAQDLDLDLVLLAHHRRDQAETFLLQALRGAGPQGLAGMPTVQWRQGVCFARPWLNQAVEVVRRGAVVAGIRSVEDPSNLDPRFARNRLRQSVWPALTGAFDQSEAALASAALRCAQALEPLLESARADVARCLTPLDPAGRRVRVETGLWAALSPARRSWVLRSWLDALNATVPSAVVDQVSFFDGTAVTSRRWSLDKQRELRWYRGVLALSEQPAKPSPVQQRKGTPPAPEALTLRLTRAGTRVVKSWSGRLVLRRAVDGECGLDLPLPLNLRLRPRHGSDQFQCSPRGHARSLKKQFQAIGVPAWAREGPVITSPEGVILMVPGLGLDARLAVTGGRWVLEWRSDSATGQQ